MWIFNAKNCIITSMSKKNVSECDVFSMLAEREFGSRVPDHRVVGGVALSALFQASAIDWDEHKVELGSSARLSNRRDNGTLRDFDVLTPATDKEQAQLLNLEMKDRLEDDMVASAFGVRPYEENKDGLFDFVGDRYLQELPDGSRKLFWRLGGIETEIPMQALEPWQVVRRGQVLFDTISPVAHLGAYINRSITGVRPKDREKLAELNQVITPNDKLRDIPANHREQYFAFLEQSRKVTVARQKLGWIGVKAQILSLLERQDWAVELAQGVLDGPLSAVVGKR